MMIIYNYPVAQIEPSHWNEMSKTGFEWPSWWRTSSFLFKSQSRHELSCLEIITLNKLLVFLILILIKLNYNTYTTVAKNRPLGWNSAFETLWGEWPVSSWIGLSLNKYTNISNVSNSLCNCIFLTFPCSKV